MQYIISILSIYNIEYDMNLTIVWKMLTNDNL